MHKLSPASYLEGLTVCGAAKALDFSSETAAQGARPSTWKQITDRLNHALNEWCLTAVQLTPCPNQAGASNIFRPAAPAKQRTLHLIRTLPPAH